MADIMYEGRPLYASDIETTGLLEDMMEQDNPQLHNIGYIDVRTGKETLIEGLYEDDVQAFLDTNPILLMHSGVKFDAEALKLLGYDVSGVKVIDTLALSWYLEPRRKRHGLAEYGEEFGVPKPIINDWKNQTQEEYNHRVMQDCRIQLRLWQKQLRQLRMIYGNDPQKIEGFIDYLMFKMKLQRAQQDIRWKFDRPKALILQDKLTAAVDEKTEGLAKVMPKVPVYAVRSRPAKFYKMNGDISAAGLKWEALCKSQGLPTTYTDDIVEITKYKEPNPGSHVQVKDWLFSLGWKPSTFKYKRNKETGEVKQTPQITVEAGELCDSVKLLLDVEPNLEWLAGFSVVKHRLNTVLKPMLRDEKDGYLTARCSGFTNTLRLIHAELVNIPSERVPYGLELRELLIADDGYELLGADLSSLEDRCKHHYQMPYDPEYVKTQMADDYDPHLLIAEIAGLLTSAQVAQYKSGDKDSQKKYKPQRHAGKGTNYSCQYGAGGATVARAAGVPEKVGNTLKDAYWELNWSILEIAKNTAVKTVDGQMWQQNPVNEYWYSLRAEKDRFSTLCQGTGAYIFDMWCKCIFDIVEEKFGREPHFLGQFHDELILMVKKSEKSRKGWRQIMEQAMCNLNEMLGMNRDMASDVQFGDNYSQIH